MKPEDLIEVAEQLASNRRGQKPKQAFLRRAVSTTYYALFHALAQCCADTLIGTNKKSGAWQLVYRSPAHKMAKNQCHNQAKIKLFPKEVQDFASCFVTMQAKRHDADYNPKERFTISSVRLDIEQTKMVLHSFARIPATKRRDFAAYVIFQNRDHH